MNPLMGMLVNQLGGQAIQQISGQIGADEGTTQSAIGMALPMILGAMGDRANTGDGASAILQASQDHDDSILDDVLGFIGNGAGGGMGSQILGQVLGGGNLNGIVNALVQGTGMNAGAAGQLLTILAPLVMSAIGKTGQAQGGLDPIGIAQMLGGMSGGNNNDMLGMATKMLDRDGDGNVMEEVGGIINQIF
jgi:hypothetical protein